MFLKTTGGRVSTWSEVTYPATTAELFPFAYKRLSDLADLMLWRIGRSLPIASTDLVHEAYIQLAGRDWNSREHLLGVATKAMRCVLVDHVRERATARRGGRWRPVPLDGQSLPVRPQRDELAVHELVESLARTNYRTAKIVRLRYFEGRTISETMTLLDLSHATIENHSKMARAWLRDRLREEYGCIR